MTKFIHPVAGAVALLTIGAFWLSTLWIELFGSQAQIVAVKTAIPWGMVILVPAIAVAAGSGFHRARGRRGGVLGAKAKRMPIIAMNGVLVLIPSALFLAWKAQAGRLDAAFYVVQVIELMAGALNLTLLGLSTRDGLRLTGKLGGRRVRAKS